MDPKFIAFVRLFFNSVRCRCDWWQLVQK